MPVLLHLPSASTWVDVREWLIGIGTLGTLLTTVIVLIRQGRELDRQASARERAERFERSSQARRVRLLAVDSRSRGGINREYEDYRLTATVHNESDDAIYDVHLVLHVSAGLANSPKEQRQKVLAAGTRLGVATEVRAAWVGANDDYEPRVTSQELTFTDAAGTRRRRDDELRLEELFSGPREARRVSRARVGRRRPAR